MDLTPRIRMPAECSSEYHTELTYYLTAEWEIAIARCVLMEADFYAVDPEIVQEYEQRSFRASGDRDQLLTVSPAEYNTALFDSLISGWPVVIEEVIEEEAARVWQQEWSKVLGGELEVNDSSLLDIARRAQNAFHFSEVGTNCHNAVWSELERCLFIEHTLRQTLKKIYNKRWEILACEYLVSFSEKHAWEYRHDSLSSERNVCIMQLQHLEREPSQFGIHPEDLPRGHIQSLVSEEFDFFLESIQNILSSNRDDYGYCDPVWKLSEVRHAIERYMDEHMGLMEEDVTEALNHCLYRKGAPNFTQV